ncbi:hypothetical protein H072_8264 [Dactylellina haptotyla CBS 200.50]|uniref:Kelch repeat protein n=1 Tax=Dactylellina haptotyla (strain CBS 200.50) TaxID=1284197 RepID=S8AA80_DACHA|nr:hypothetical protein H072_8264 [Dactylellina haptotyla CBS 200.50]
MAASSPYNGDPFSRYCALSGQQSLLLGEKLFITGGYFVQTPNRTVSAGPWFRIIDLRTSFALNQLESSTDILPPSVYPPTVPIVQNGVFWFDSLTSSIFYSQGASTVDGGIFKNVAQHTDAVNGKSWTAEYNPTNTSLGLWRQIDTPFNGQTGAAVSRRTFYDGVARKGYIYGGWVTTGGNNVFTDEFLTYDAATSIWTNSTIPYGRMDGQGAGIPFRTADGRILAIIFGGLLNGTPVAINDDGLCSRGFFCSSMISAPDNSSHQILVYSGLPSSGDAEYTDIWALSLPSFTWIQIQASDTEEYRIPEVIFNAIGGNSSRYATLTAPPGGFADPEMTSIFALAAPTNPSNNGNATAGSNRNVGAIAGGTVGGIVGVVGLAFAFILFRRRQRRPVPMPPLGDDPRDSTRNGAFEIEPLGSEFQGPHLIGDSVASARGVFEVENREAKPPPMELPAEDVDLSNNNPKNDTRERKPLLPWRR